MGATDSPEEARVAVIQALCAKISTLVADPATKDAEEVERHLIALSWYATGKPDLDAPPDLVCEMDGRRP